MRLKNKGFLGLKWGEKAPKRGLEAKMKKILLTSLALALGLIGLSGRDAYSIMNDNAKDNWIDKLLDEYSNESGSNNSSSGSSSDPSSDSDSSSSFCDLLVYHLENNMIQGCPSGECVPSQVQVITVKGSSTFCRIRVATNQWNINSNNEELLGFHKGEDELQFLANNSSQDEESLVFVHDIASPDLAQFAQYEYLEVAYETSAFFKTGDVKRVTYDGVAVGEVSVVTPYPPGEFTIGNQFGSPFGDGSITFPPQGEPICDAAVEDCSGAPPVCEGDECNNPPPGKEVQGVPNPLNPLGNIDLNLAPTPDEPFCDAAVEDCSQVPPPCEGDPACNPPLPNGPLGGNGINDINDIGVLALDDPSEVQFSQGCALNPHVAYRFGFGGFALLGLLFASLPYRWTKGKSKR